jgi:hypothetical protein
MSWEKPSSNDELPFVVNAPEDKWCSFEFKPSSLKKQKNAKGWSMYALKTRDALDHGGNEIIGTSEIPFWAMEPFFDTFVNRADETGWVDAQFRITKEGNQRFAEFREAE